MYCLILFHLQSSTLIVSGGQYISCSGSSRSRYLTIEEKFGSLKGIRMAYLGDIRNNVTYDLMRSGALMGFTVAVAPVAGALLFLVAVPSVDNRPDLADGRLVVLARNLLYCREN